MTETKLSRLLAAASRSDWREALRIAARFPDLGKHAAAIKRGHEAHENARFYEQLGMNSAELIEAGIAALCDRYSINNGVSDMTKKYTAKSAAVRAARKELDNPAAKPGEDFELRGNDLTGWSYKLPPAAEDQQPEAAAAELPAELPTEAAPEPEAKAAPLAIPAALLRPPVTAEQRQALDDLSKRISGPEREIRMPPDIKAADTQQQGAPKRSKADGPKPGTVSRQVYDLLMRPEGATSKDCKAEGLVDISVLAYAREFAKSYDLALSFAKEGKVTRVYLRAADSQPAPAEQPSA
ncbi:hypothetical protein KQX64_07040 [Rhodopseudomonas palustris]|nr:hypothetical protein KQX64_07040 [Rhodopseudomonas palustris]